MNVRFALAFVIASTSLGCATPAEQSRASAPAQSAQSQERCYSSGSRLPSTDCGGSSTVGGQSGDDYRRDQAASPTGLQR
jgi:hypothetical protein